MPSLTQMYRSPMSSSASSTSSILINKSSNRIPRNRLNDSHSLAWSNDNEISLSAQHLYDHATWRMYFRIINGRKRRAQLLEGRNKNSDGQKLSRSREQNDNDNNNGNRHHSKKAIKAERKERQRQRSLSTCSDISHTAHDEEIFALDL